MTKFFFLLEIIDMNTSQEIELYFEFTLYFEIDWMDVKLCNFNKDGELILFCEVEASVGNMNLVCVYSYSIQTKPIKTKRQKIYMIPKEAEVINISKDDKFWLYFNNDIYEWNLPTGYTTILSKNIYEVINNI